MLDRERPAHVGGIPISLDGRSPISFQFSSSTRAFTAPASYAAEAAARHIAVVRQITRHQTAAGLRRHRRRGLGVDLEGVERRWRSASPPPTFSPVLQPWRAGTTRRHSLGAGRSCVRDAGAAIQDPPPNATVGSCGAVSHRRGRTARQRGSDQPSQHRKAHQRRGGLAPKGVDRPLQPGHPEVRRDGSRPAVACGRVQASWSCSA